MFLDESGSISNDRYFAVGCLKASPPAALTRQVQSYRDRTNFHAEFKFSAVTKNTLGYFKDLVDLTPRERRSAASWLTGTRRTQ